MNEPGDGTDMFWFTTKFAIAGEAPFSLDSDGDKKADLPEYVALNGGNIVVPHVSSSGDDGGDINTPPTKPEKKK